MKNFQEIIQAAVREKPVVLAVIAPHDENTLSAVVMARQEHVADPRLYGDADKIRAALTTLGEDPETYTIVACTRPIQAAIAAVRDGTCDFIMKGKVTTPAVMSACLSKSTGLNLGRGISSVTVAHIPAYGKLLTVSDGGLNIAPTLEQKIDFTRNMIDVLHALDIPEPKIAVLSSTEEVSLKIPASMDAAILTQMNRRGQISGAIVDGPLAFDNIVSIHSAQKKGISSPVAGDADGILVPNIECGNAIVKSFRYFADSTNATVVVGAMAPIMLPSRAGDRETKLAALCVGALLAEKIKEAKG